MQHKGERHYQLYGRFSSMRVARVMQAVPSNCRFLVPFMYPCDKKQPISPIPMREHIKCYKRVRCYRVTKFNYI